MSGNLIFELIPKIMGEIGAIGKNGTNKFDNYKFRSVDDVYNKVQPVLAANGVFFKPTVLESHESTIVSKAGADQIRVKQKVEYTFYAKDGSNFKTVVEGEAIDRGDKATNKAMTAALKYMLIQVFCIAIVGADDADADSPEIGDVKPQGPTATQTVARAVVKAPVKKQEPKLADYVVPMGKHQGKTLGSMDVFELNNYLQWLVNSAQHDNKPLMGKVKEFAETAEAYLMSREKQPDELKHVGQIA